MKKTIVALCMAALTITACTKTGPAGPAGTAGTNGNANINTWLVTINPADWNTSLAASGFYYEDIPTDSITAAVVSKGAVSVYNEGSTGIWVAMPYQYFATATVFIEYGYTYNQGNCRIWLQTSNASTINFSGESNFKIVVIPPQQ